MSKKVNVGDAVVLSSSADAVRWEVLGVDGVMITVREENTSYRPQLIDECQIYERVIYLGAGAGNGPVTGNG